MSESETSDAKTDPTSAESLLRALRSAAGDQGTREAIAQLGERARNVVEELARTARSRPAPAPASPAHPRNDETPGRAKEGPRSATAQAMEAALPDLHRRLGELRAGVGEVADVLEATVERLETIEEQLGHPDAAIERQLAEGMQRCERLLMGIGHRVQRREAPAPAPASAACPPALPTVLVISRDSQRRARLCLALEAQGCFALALRDTRAASALLRRRPASVALLDLDGSAQDIALRLDEWVDGEKDGDLPPAALLLRTSESPGLPERFGMQRIDESHGEAAMAACLLQCMRAGTADAVAREGE